MRFFMLVPLLLAACQTAADTGTEHVIDGGLTAQ